MADTRDFLKLHFIVLLWGFTAILGKLIHIGAIEIVLYRTLFASIGLWLLLKMRQRDLSIPWPSLWRMLGTGLLIAAHWVLFFAAARISTVAVCLAGMATTSLWTSFLEPFMTGRKIKAYEVGLGAIVIVGLYIIFRFEFDHALGLTFALASAFLAALFTVINSLFVRKYNGYVITLYEMMGACMSTLLLLSFMPFFFPEIDILWMPVAWDWVALLVLALVCTVYAYSASIELMRKFSAFTVNLTVNLEPVYGIILAFFIFGDNEKMTLGFYLGTLIILASVLIYPMINRYYQRKAIETDILR